MTRVVVEQQLANGNRYDTSGTLEPLADTDSATATAASKELIDDEIPQYEESSKKAEQDSCQPDDSLLDSQCSSGVRWELEERISILNTTIPCEKSR